MRYFITGHTGFKGAWLSTMLSEAGHELYGLSLDPEPGALFDTAGLASRFSGDFRGDVRDGEFVRSCMHAANPDIVIHMAAQPLVRDSYIRPRWTMETNVMGTLSVLEAAAEVASLQSLVVVTTDKVYRNVGQVAGYVETDSLGGYDPYSASKAMADLLVSSWVSSFNGPPTAIARAGNVIGGGDVSSDRLLPDLLRSFEAGKPADIRYPDAVRPWQHVLDCLNGYVLLSKAVQSGEATGAWNFGPPAESFRTVAEVANLASATWGSGATWTSEAGNHPHEAALLTLDATRAREELNWNDRLSFAESVRWTVEWTKRVHAGEKPLSVVLDQLAQFESLS
jgi:CDP-glucose 4,6-dehydratase